MVDQNTVESWRTAPQPGDDWRSEFYFETPLPRHQTLEDRALIELYGDPEEALRNERALMRMAGRADELPEHYRTPEAYNDYRLGWMEERNYAAEYAPETMGETTYETVQTGEGRFVSTPGGTAWIPETKQVEVEVDPHDQQYAPGGITGGAQAGIAIRRAVPDLASSLLRSLPLGGFAERAILGSDAVREELSSHKAYMSGRNAYLQTVTDPDSFMHMFTNTAPMIGIALIPGGAWAAAGFAGTQAYGSAAMEYESRAAAMEFAYDETDAR